MGTTRAPVILKPAELAERWGCSVDVLFDRMRTKAVPFIWLGKGEAKLTTAGRKHVVFRLDYIEAWEAEQMTVWEAGEQGGEAEVAAKRGRRKAAVPGRAGGIRWAYENGK